MGQLETLKQAILDIFLECFDTRIESPELDLLEARLVDSLRVVDLVLALEDRFGVSLPFEELEIEDFRTVSRLAERVVRTPVVAA
jgi:D-alanine--poly(phosphoribitol) ligase subunit 2